MSFHKIGRKPTLTVSSNLPQVIKEIVYIDRPVHFTNEVLKEITVEKPIVTFKEEIRYIDREIIKEIIVEKQVEVIKFETVYVDKLVEVPVEKVVEKIKEIELVKYKIPKLAIFALILETVGIITLILTK